MELRSAKNEDRDEFAKLWCADFGDSVEYSDFVFDSFAGVDKIFLIEDSGEIIAAAAAIPVTLANKNGVYLYGLNTKEANRGKGVMQSLIEGVHKKSLAQGYDFAVLIPASEKLFKYYEKFGYETKVRRRLIQLSIKNNLWAVAEFDTVTASRLTMLREKHINGSIVTLGDNHHNAMMADLYSGGATTIETEDGYGVFFEIRGVAVFKEFNAKSDSAARYILEAVRQKTRLEEAAIYVEELSELFLGQGDMLSYAMVSPLTDAVIPADIYMGLMCD